jgi:hypothetical protein
LKTRSINDFATELQHVVAEEHGVYEGPAVAQTQKARGAIGKLEIERW